MLAELYTMYQQYSFKDSHGIGTYALPHNTVLRCDNDVSEV